MDPPALSSIRLPWPLRRNPHADHYLQASLDALSHAGLLKDQPADSGRRMLEGIYERDLCAYPDADREGLVAAGLFSQWWCLLGEQIDDALEAARSPQHVEALLTDAFETLRAGLLLPSPSAFARFTNHLRMTLLALAPEGWWGRFIDDVEESIFSGSLEAARYRARAATPPLDRYLALRLHGSAAFPALDMVEIASGLRLTEDVLRHPTLVAMRRLAARHIAHLGDFASYHEDAARASAPCDLLDVLMHDGGLSVEQAVRWIIDTANADLRQFLELEATLPRWSAGASAPAQRYVDGMKHRMSGSLAFSTSRPRCSAHDTRPAKPRALTAWTVFPSDGRA